MRDGIDELVDWQLRHSRAATVQGNDTWWRPRPAPPPQPWGWGLLLRRLRRWLAGLWAPRGRWVWCEDPEQLGYWLEWRPQ